MCSSLSLYLCVLKRDGFGQSWTVVEKYSIGAKRSKQSPPSR